MNTSNHALDNTAPNAVQLLADEPEWAAVLGDTPDAVGITDSEVRGLAFEVLEYLSEGKVRDSDLDSGLGAAVLADMRGGNGLGWGFALAVQTGGVALQRWASEYMSGGIFDGFAITSFLGSDDWVSEIVRRVADFEEGAADADEEDDEIDFGGKPVVRIKWV